MSEMNALFSCCLIHMFIYHLTQSVQAVFRRFRIDIIKRWQGIHTDFNCFMMIIDDGVLLNIKTEIQRIRIGSFGSELVHGSDYLKS
jgi:hypothetical protein